jgi:hypothetical protein
MNASMARTLLGFDRLDVELLLICPVISIYRDILKGRSALVHPPHSGFLPCAYFPEGGLSMPGDALCVATPQGVSSADVIHCANARHVLVIGYAGGLSESASIGDVVEATTAIGEDGALFAGVGTGTFPQATVGTSPCLAGPRAEGAVAAARRHGATVVDMESAACFQAAGWVGANASSWLLVTDRPGEKDFWRLSSKDTNAMEAGRRVLLEVLHG